MNAVDLHGPDILVRRAVGADAQTIVRFNAAMASETEGLKLDPATLSQGVAAALADSSKAIYFVAETHGAVIAQLMVTHEWSDWRNGDIWWVQSVYVDPDFRQRGIFRMLYEHTRRSAAGAGAVGMRLYVEENNRLAQDVYVRLGMQQSHYRIMEEFFH